MPESRVARSRYRRSPAPCVLSRAASVPGTLIAGMPAQSTCPQSSWAHEPDSWLADHAGGCLSYPTVRSLNLACALYSAVYSHDNLYPYTHVARSFPRINTRFLSPFNLGHCFLLYRDFFRIFYVTSESGQLRAPSLHCCLKWLLRIFATHLQRVLTRLLMFPLLF